VPTLSEVPCTAHLQQQQKRHIIKKQALVDIRLRPSLATPRGVLYFATPSPRMVIRPTTAKRDVIHKSGSIAYRIQNFMKIGPGVPEICSRIDRHTDRQMDWSQQSAPLPRQSKHVNMLSRYVCKCAANFRLISSKRKRCSGINGRIMCMKTASKKFSYCRLLVSLCVHAYICRHFLWVNIRYIYNCSTT